MLLVRITWEFFRGLKVVFIVQFHISLQFLAHFFEILIRYNIINDLTPILQVIFTLFTI